MSSNENISNESETYDEYQFLDEWMKNMGQNKSEEASILFSRCNESSSSLYFSNSENLESKYSETDSDLTYSPKMSEDSIILEQKSTKIGGQDQNLSEIYFENNNPSISASRESIDTSEILLMNQEYTQNNNQLDNQNNNQLDNQNNNQLDNQNNFIPILVVPKSNPTKSNPIRPGIGPTQEIRLKLKDGIKINKIDLETNITINKKLNKNILISNIIEEIPSATEKNRSPVIKTFDLMAEAKQRTIQQNKRTENDVPLRRFVIETEENSLRMEEILKLKDLKNRNIVGKLMKKGGNSFYQSNWFLLRETFFTCFSSKKNKITTTEFPRERNGDITCPEDPSVFLTKKYTIDLIQSKMFLSKKKSKRDFFFCFSETIPAEADLIDITDSVILNIKKGLTGYVVTVQNGFNRREHILNCLNFGLKTLDGYHFYKTETIEDFLKWIIAFKFRLGQITCNIG